MIQLINVLANLILLVFCLWAVLDKELETHIFGTLALSITAISAFVNMTRPEVFGILSMQSEVLVNVSVAVLVVWFWRYCRKLRKRKTK